MSEQRTKYVARSMQHDLPLTDDLKDFLRRRTAPFLDGVGLQSRPLSVLVQEAYLQGLADAIAALKSPDPPP